MTDDYHGLYANQGEFDTPKNYWSSFCGDRQSWALIWTRCRPWKSDPMGLNRNPNVRQWGNTSTKRESERGWGTTTQNRNLKARQGGTTSTRGDHFGKGECKLTRGDRH
eukprot:scaffold9085_cov215-Amphora_coffeaeformis.AAC.2